MPIHQVDGRCAGRGRGVSVLACLVLWAGAGCETTPPTEPSPTVRQTVPASLMVPHTVQRLAVLYRRAVDRDEREAYRRLEGAAFQLKELRSSLQIVERTHLNRILDEQRLQAIGPVSEETAIHIGRLVGVDSVLMYEIHGPSRRDRLLARRSAELPPLIITSKIIRVETAEVVFHNVVTAAVENAWDGDDGLFADRGAITILVRAALARGVDRTITDLRRAFR